MNSFENQCINIVEILSKMVDEHQTLREIIRIKMEEEEKKEEHHVIECINKDLENAKRKKRGRLRKFKTDEETKLYHQQKLRDSGYHKRYYEAKKKAKRNKLTSQTS